MERDENIGLKQDKTVKLSDMDFDQLDSLLFYIICLYAGLCKTHFALLIMIFSLDTW